MRFPLTIVMDVVALTIVKLSASNAKDREGSKPQTFEITDRYTSSVTSFFDRDRGIGGPGQPASDVRPALGLILRNKTDRVLWFEVHCVSCHPAEIATK